MMMSRFIKMFERKISSTPSATGIVVTFPICYFFFKLFTKANNFNTTMLLNLNCNTSNYVIFFF